MEVKFDKFFFENVSNAFFFCSGSMVSLYVAILLWEIEFDKEQN